MYSLVRNEQTDTATSGFTAIKGEGEATRAAILLHMSKQQKPDHPLHFFLFYPRIPPVYKIHYHHYQVPICDFTSKLQPGSILGRK